MTKTNETKAPAVKAAVKPVPRKVSLKAMDATHM